MKKNLNFILIYLLVVLSVMFSQNRACAGEDIYYLENEIKDTEAKYKVVHGDLQRIDDFVNKYPAMTDSLAKAHKELDDLDQKMKSILKKNLIKSTISLGFDTIGKVDLVLGFATQSIKLIVLACACEFASDQMQKSFSSPYSTTVKGLSDEAQKLAPEIGEVQKTLSMDLIDLKIKVMRGGEDPDNLGETGLIFRKFDYVIDSIEKAKKKIYELRRKLDSTKNDVEAQRPLTAEEDARLAKRLEELKKRLGTAYQEKTREQNSQIQSQVNSQATVKVNPARIPVKDEEQRQVLIAQYRDKLMTCVADGHKEVGGIGGRLNTEATGIFPDKNYNPLQDRDAAYVASPVSQAVSGKEIAQMAPEMLTQEINFYRTLIDFNKKLKPVVDKYPGQYEGFATEYTRKITPILSALAGLGADYLSLNADGPLREATAQSILLSMIGKKLPQESAIYEKNIEGMKAQLALLAGRAAAFAAKFSTEATNILNVCTFAITKGKAVIQNTESAGFKSGPEAIKHLNKVRSNVAQMYASGADGAKVKEYLEKEKKMFFDIYEPAAQAGHLRALALNTRFQSEEKLRSDPDYALMKKFSEWYPEKGVKDAEQPYGKELWDVDMNANPIIREGVFHKCGEIENWSYDCADRIKEFISLIGKIDEVNQKVRSLFGSHDPSTANSKIPEAMSVLDSERETLGPWLKSYASADGKTPGRYDIFSSETRNVIAAAATDAENKIKQEEEKKRQEEERKKDEKRFSDYLLTGPRVNTYDLSKSSGEVILLPDQLREGKMSLTGWLSHVDGIDKIFFSEDGGRTWRETSVQQAVQVELSPMTDKRYEPKLRIKTKLSKEYDLPFFPNITGLVYRNVSYADLVRDVVVKIANAYESRNTAAFAGLISKDYIGNRVYLEEGVRFDFDMFTDIRLKIFIDRIEKRAELYVADTHWEKSQNPRKTGQQQMTTGKTVMMFALEDGTLKIKNLRGNLIYATLSPEIAEASGLSQKIVEEIRVAKFERIPIQPGAGDTANNGGLGSSILTTRQGAMRSTYAVAGNCFSARTDGGFDFSSGVEVTGAGDLYLEWTSLLWEVGSAQMQTSTTDFSSLKEAPSGGYGTGGIPAVTGNTYVFITQEGLYGKMKVTSTSTTAPNCDNSVVNFQYALQTDGSRNLSTS